MNTDQNGKPKRFYESAGIAASDGGWRIILDGRAARSPGKAVLTTPHEVLARAAAEEWAAQGEVIDFPGMPLTRRLMAWADRAPEAPAIWRKTVTDYLATDLLCYRAESPADLVMRQAAAFDPWLDWLEDRFGVRLVVASGIIAVDQPAAAVAVVATHLDSLPDETVFNLAGAVELCGSAVLALALADTPAAAEELFAASLVDEQFQRDKWGSDGEALDREARRRTDFLAIATCLGAVGQE